MLVEDPEPAISFVDLLIVSKLPPPRIRYNCGQDIASHSCITSNECLTFLKEQCLANEAKEEAAKEKKKKKKKDLVLKKRLKKLALKRFQSLKRKIRNEKEIKRDEVGERNNKITKSL